MNPFDMNFGQYLVFYSLSMMVIWVVVFSATWITYWLRDRRRRKAKKERSHDRS